MKEVTVKIEGLEGIEKKLKEIPQKFAYRGMRRALRRGANVIRDHARSNAKRLDDPQTREQIAKNIAVAGGGSKRERQAGGPMMRVGVMGGARFNAGAGGLPGGNTTGYWRLLEFGTSKMRAQPFMRTAIVSGAEPAIGAVASAAQVELDKELRKLNVP